MTRTRVTIVVSVIWLSLGLGLVGQEAAAGVGQDKNAAVTPATPINGATLFHEKGCEYCHGVSGTGTERGPALLGVGRKLRTEQISKQIHEGGGAMPAFGEVLSTPEIDALIAYLETLKKAAPAGKRKPAAATHSPGEAR